MRADETYNQMIAEIEKYIREQPDMTSSGISLKLMEEYGFLSKGREFNAVFQFINGKTPNKYIAHRKMIYACESESAKNTERINVQYMMEIVNMTEQTSFIRAFKNMFGSSPNLFLKKHENFKGEEPAYWGTLNEEAESGIKNMNTETIKNDNNTVFGIDMDTYHRIVRFQNLAASYGCSGIGAEAGYRFSEKHGMSLEKSFEYAAQFEEAEENIKELYEDEISDGTVSRESSDFEKYKMDYLLEGMENELIMYCYFELGLEVDAAWDVKRAMDENEFDRSKLDKPHAFALSYTSGATTAYEAWRLTDYYLSRNAGKEVNYEIFSEFLDEAPDNPESAWDYAYDMSNIDWNDIEDILNSPGEDESELDLIAGLAADEERREGWEYYRDTKHYFEDDDLDEELSEEDEDTLADHYWDGFDGDTYEDEFDADGLTVYEYEY